ncbi:MAG: FAD-dependent oxidoreductase [Oscillospiraceae bacterium]|jgi:2,4-dienoyl-CoA reductase (NADPH2)|nr:FAD-dependent oxidoreductase [Oscillospiraceae bacterium]
MKYQRLFSPIRIGGLELKNRVVMSAVHLMYNMDGYANARFSEFYWRRAEGGAALVFVGGCRFDEYGGSPGMMSLQTDDFIPGYRKFTDGMHLRGAKAGVQLYHAGAYAHSIANEGREALAPSAVLSKFTKEMPKEMTRDEIKTVIAKWAEAAARAKRAGFDVVEISASAGYLISQFLSPKTNLRTDEYGGSWENRVRFPLEVVAAVRGAVGPDYPVCVRIAGNDFVPGSNTNAEAVLFAQRLEKAGIQLINVTGGWHETVIPQLTGELPRGGFTYLAAAVRDAVDIPVAASNRINDPALAERVLAAGEADLVSLARPLIADPDWPGKAEKGEDRLIRRCVACNQGCLAKTFFAEPVECLVNGFAGREAELKPRRAKEPKAILVLGAGPAGCEFAVQAAAAGHDVTVWEKAGVIGGQLLLAAASRAKREFLNLVPYYSAMFEKLGVTLSLSKNASPGEIVASGFDIVVTATGSTPKSIALPEGADMPVCSALDIFSGRVTAGRDVVILGGGAVGCECAGFLAEEAALSPDALYFMLSQRSETPEKALTLLDRTRRSITIVDVAKIGTGFEPGTAWPLMKALTRFGVKQYPFAAVLGATASSVEIEAPEPKTREQRARARETGAAEPKKRIRARIPCDTLIVASGALPDDRLYRALRDDCPEIYNIGDSCRPGKISDAVAQAIALAMKL